MVTDHWGVMGEPWEQIAMAIFSRPCLGIPMGEPWVDIAMAIFSCPCPGIPMGEACSSPLNHPWVNHGLK